MRFPAKFTKKLAVFKNNRLEIIVAVVLLFALAAAARLFFVQIIKYKFYSGQILKQDSLAGAAAVAERGDIYFKDKNGDLVKAATTKTGALVYLNTKFLKNSGDVFNKLNAITPLDRAVFDKAAKKINDPYEIIKHRLSAEDGEKIKALGLPGVGVAEEKWRFYPAGKMASQVLGFASLPDAAAALQGQYGVEKYYNDSLNDSEDVVLTIDPSLENIVEQELAKLREKWKAESGGILILDPKTGAILALAGSPSFDPNSYQSEKNLGVFLNPFTEKIFELGSVFKALTMASAIDQNALRPDTTYLDPGQVTINGRTIKNYDGKSHGVRTMTQVLEESLNTGAIFAMERLGGEKLKDYFHSFGLGEKLGVDLPGELKGNLSNLDSGREVEFATASFGQGIAVTPLELAAGLSALANGGHLMRPFVKDGASPQIIRDVIKPETSATVSKMLVDVVDMALAGGQAKIPHYSIAAKTGTAQMPNVGGRGYSDQFLHSYFGYLPAYNPRFLILIFIEKPQGVKYASQSITDTFRTLVEFLINYYAIPPDR